MGIEQVIKQAELISQQACQISQRSELALQKTDQILQKSEHILEKSNQILDKSDHVMDKSDHILKQSEQLRELVEFGPNWNGIKTAHPSGHFYSPVTDPEDLSKRSWEIWPPDPKPCQDIAFSDDTHQAVLSDWFPKYINDFDYPKQSADPGKFFTQNSQFSWLDAPTLFVLMRELKPRQVIEIGSGFSTLLMADIIHRFLQNETRLSCIEPYPRDFLKKEIPGLHTLHVERVEKMGFDIYRQLQAGDILFVDSSHVSKTGSDVNFIIFEVLPKLPMGVYIHFHDIFLPNDYPKDWAIAENRSWNEQYLIQALLMNSNAYEVFFGCSYAYAHHDKLVARALSLAEDSAYAGSSLWLKKIS